MKYRTSFPHPIREIENLWIPLSDGTRLAARMWLPVDADRHPVPAVLQYIPYRKRDFTAQADEDMHPYFAGHGYAALRVDQRGSGDSDGLMFDEYDLPELADGAEVVEWIAGQPWCTGKVGMLGNSWSGFNALQVAARQPKGLGAIITSCSTDDRYADDMHYMGGCLLTDTMDWGTVFFGHFPRPPDPQIVGPRWRDMWQERLEHAPLPIETWLRHQRRDQYWKPGSVCEDYRRIQVPTYACAGWLDGYSNTVPRLLANLDVPRLGLVGPWKHAFPHRGWPAPYIGWLQEAVRWWDRWLKGIDNAIMSLPMYRVWLQEDVPAKTVFTSVPGRWVSEPSWPSPAIRARRFHLSRGTLTDGPRHPTEELPTEELPIEELKVRPLQTAGLSGGEWCPGGTGGTGTEFASDQRDDDGKSLCFDSVPVTERFEVLGAPVVELDIAVDQPQANLIVRLCDVSEAGASVRVSYGALNLSHRSSHEFPVPMAPGARTRVRVQLNDCAHAFTPGHRIRLAVSPNYWPMIWPSPEVVTLSVFTASSHLDLPHRPPRPGDAAIAFEEPEAAEPTPITWLRPASAKRTLAADCSEGVVEVINFVDAGKYVSSTTGLIVGGIKTEYNRIQEDDPLSAESKCSRTVEMGRSDNPIRLEVSARLTADREHFFLEGGSDTYEGQRRIHSKAWNVTIPRDHV